MIDAGGVIVEILATTLGARPTRSQLDAWINTYRIPVTTVMDPLGTPGTGTVTLNTYGIRESAFVVNLETMRIVIKVNGSVAGAGDSAVAQIIPRMLTLLRGM